MTTYTAIAGTTAWDPSATTYTTRDGTTNSTALAVNDVVFVYVPYRHDTTDTTHTVVDNLGNVYNEIAVSHYYNASDNSWGCRLFWSQVTVAGTPTYIRATAASPCYYFGCFPVVIKGLTSSPLQATVIYKRSTSVGTAVDGLISNDVNITAPPVALIEIAQNLVGANGCYINVGTGSTLLLSGQKVSALADFVKVAHRRNTRLGNQHASFTATQNGDDMLCMVVAFSEFTTDPLIYQSDNDNPIDGSTLTISGVNFGATQGTSSITIGGSAATVLSWSDTSVQIRTDVKNNKYGTNIDVVLTARSLSTTYTLTTIQPPAGYGFVNLTSINPSPTFRITAIPDLAIGDQLVYANADGEIIYPDATFSAPQEVDQFPVKAWSPSSWGAFAYQSFGSGLSKQIIASGTTTTGLNYVDMRFFGVPLRTDFNAIYFEDHAFIAASLAENWTTSAFVSLIAGSLSNVKNFGIGFIENDTTGTSLVDGLITAFTPGSTLTRYTGTHTIQQTNTAYFNGCVRWEYNNILGHVDFTLRIAVPQIEKGRTASSLILTSGSILTRAADVNTAGLLSNIPENEYPAWDSTHTYVVGNRVIILAEHNVYESLQNANTNRTPAAGTNPTYWAFVGKDDAWAMFDDKVGTQTTYADLITTAIKLTARIDSVVLMNVTARTARVSMTDSVDGVVYSSTQKLISTEGITNWYSYFFEEIQNKDTAVFSDLPPYANATLTVTLEDTGATAACGECVIGMAKDIGGTQYGAAVGIQDYSNKTQDAFGDFEINEKPFSKTGDFTVFVPSGLTDQLERILAKYRATPIVYIGSDFYDSMLIYGFYKDFNIEVRYQDMSVCTIQIEGLT